MAKKSEEASEKPESVFRHLKPRLVPIRLSPFKQQYRNARSGLSFFSRAQTQIEDEGARCPRCNHVMALAPSDAPGNDKPALVCGECGFVEDLSIPNAEADRTAHALDQQSNQTFYIGLGVGVIAALIAVFNGSVFTLIGGVLIGSIILMQSGAFRYRAWQYRNRRLYESAPPFREWLRDQLGWKR